MDFSGKRFLIIAGQPKAGTTSLFDWLVQHPDICASNVKETRFFLDADYPLPRSFGYDGTNLASYARYFDRLERKVLMEATPDYLYSDTALQIATALPNARLVVIERDPVDRVRSAYGFFRQRGMVPADMSLDAYVARQAAEPVTAGTPVPFRAVDQCAPGHLERFRAAFGERLLVLEFAALKDSPDAVLAQVCAHARLAPPAATPRGAANVTGEARNATAARLYYALDQRLRHRLRDIPLLRPVLRPLGRGIRRLLARPARASARADMSPEQSAVIRAIAAGTRALP